jgi:hypothetical protein
LLTGVIVTPLEWFPRLQHAAPSHRTHWRTIGGGVQIYGPDLDEDHLGRGAARDTLIEAFRAAVLPMVRRCTATDPRAIRYPRS